MSNEELKEKIEAWLRSKEKTAVAGFRPSAVRKAVPGATKKEVEEILLSLAAEGRLNVEWEITCPECFSLIKTTAKRPEREIEEYCWHCGREVWLDTFQPVFYFPGKEARRDAI
ncbi:hypothetical protein E308F_17800 [Moorella sp. E308F]|uniref:hypothetical protein n=1 Tax=unclassified Neomoorella TaxID=2676739 RepID=UPI0010FFAF38|nr:MULTISPECIES: hypothetical protein [unclassified Moorella (in: firmicutes)]GEA15536.1 hypothetical protein E308F_17800 [Moorella sp. E308F]GEA19606.1 hypothetical protein E306M_27440 [Moorella sp. E306M]